MSPTRGLSKELQAQLNASLQHTAAKSTLSVPIIASSSLLGGGPYILGACQLPCSSRYRWHMLGMHYPNQRVDDELSVWAVCKPQPTALLGTMSGEANAQYSPIKGYIYFTFYYASLYHVRYIASG